MGCLTLLHSERPKLHILAVLSAIGLKGSMFIIRMMENFINMGLNFTLFITCIKL